MKLTPSGIGAEPKKLALLGAILAIGGVVYWLQNRSSGPDQTVSATATPPPVVARVQTPPQSAVTPAASQAERSSEPPIPGMQRRRPGSAPNSPDDMQDFHPTLKVKDDMDLSKIDPRIKLDLLAKVRAVPMEGGSSSLFEFGKPPEPPPPPVAAINPGPVPPPAPQPPKVVTPPTPPPPPPAPPIPFKYYGYAGKSSDGQLQEGLFIEGDPQTGDLFQVKEGDVLKNRYKIVRIGIRSAIVEDTVTHDQKTLQLLEEQQ